jgi:chitinase
MLRRAMLTTLLTALVLVPAVPAQAAPGLTATFSAANNGSWFQDKFVIANPTSLDFGNVQGYDFHGAGSDNSWEPNRTGHEANLLRETQDPYAFEFSINKAIQTYLDAGVNPRRLTIGFPFYGRGWQGVLAGSVNGEWQSATGAAPGQFQEEAGTRGYANLIATVPGCTVFHDTQSISTYCLTGNRGQWWTFDDAWSIGQKTAWLKGKGLLGAMVWEMSGDTPSGSLMTTLHNGL